jgi:hypothetical protein
VQGFGLTLSEVVPLCHPTVEVDPEIIYFEEEEADVRLSPANKYQLIEIQI